MIPFHADLNLVSGNEVDRKEGIEKMEKEVANTEEKMVNCKNEIKYC